MRISLLIAAAAVAVLSANAASAANLLDDFNRPNQTGSLGPEWTVLKNGATISGNVASGGTQSLSLYSGPDAYSSNQVEFDFIDNPGQTAGYYAGALLNWDGTSGYFLKIQHDNAQGAGYGRYSLGHVTYNSSIGTFAYTNDSGFLLIGQLFTTGHLTASVVNNLGTLTLTSGASTKTFTYNYAQTYTGTGIGLGIQDGGKADNFASLEPAAVPEPATWAMMIGGFGLVGGAMRSARRSDASLRAAA